jgi:hypothetical protein
MRSDSIRYADQRLEPRSGRKPRCLRNFFRSHFNKPLTQSSLLHWMSEFVRRLETERAPSGRTLAHCLRVVLAVNPIEPIWTGPPHFDSAPPIHGKPTGNWKMMESENPSTVECSDLCVTGADLSSGMRSDAFIHFEESAGRLVCCAGCE